MSFTDLALDALPTDALVAPTDVVDAPAPTSTRSLMWTVLLGGSVLTGFAMLMSVIDRSSNAGWELVHWHVSAATALAATMLSVRGSSGLARRIRIGSVLALTA